MGEAARARQPWVVRRRRGRHAKPLRRIGAALQRGAPLAVPADALPGLPSRASTRTHVVSGAIAIGLHAAVLGLLVGLAALAPPELIEQLLPVELLEPSEPGPAPRAIAESRAAFAPAPQAVMPQVLNPDVVARAAPVAVAEVLQLDAVGSVTAPTRVERARVEAQHVSAVRSVAAATTAPVIAPVAPALRGPIEVVAPVGPSVGPRAVVSGGDTVGLAAPGALGTGSSVREGIASDRDVAGAPTGPRLASVNTRVGNSLWGAGPGGEGTGLGTVSFEECTGRPEVQAYMELVRDRMISRWVIPPGVPPDQSVTLQFKLDVAGSATNVDLVQAQDRQLGDSAVRALRSASPFPPMSDRVRCLARDRLIAKFKNPLGGNS